MNILKTCLGLLESGRNVVMITVLKSSGGTPGKPGFKLLVTDEGKLFGTIGGGALEHRAIEEAREVHRRGENQVREYNLEELGMTCGGRTTLAWEYLPAPKAFLLFGGGHIGRALAPILSSLGFQVTVYDPRPEVPESIPENPNIEVITGAYQDVTPVKERLKAAEFCFIATHGHEHDFTVLRQVLELSDHYRYVGLIGSKNKIRTTLKRLKETGLAVPDYLYAPVGIQLGGDTAAEIAVSIAAEVVARMHGTPANHMRDTVKGKL